MKYAMLLLITMLTTPALLATEITISSKQVLEQKNCFSGDNADYASFIAAAKKKNETPPDTAFQSPMSAGQFEKMQQSIDCQVIHYDVAGVVVEGFVVKPKQQTVQGVIIYNRDGATGWSGLDLVAIEQKLSPLANLGYLVVASQYRGLDLWPSTVKGDVGKDEFGGADLADVEALLPIIDQLAPVESKKLYMVGEGRGGMMGFMLARKIKRLNGLIVIGTASDLADQLIRRNDLLRVYQQHIPEFNPQPWAKLSERSVVDWIPQIPKTLPILMLHGEEDKIVDVRQANLLQTLFTGAKVNSTLILYPNVKHDLGEQRQNALQDIKTWLTEISQSH